MEIEVIFYHQSIGFYNSRGSDLLGIYRMLWLSVWRKVVLELFWNLLDYIRMWELPGVKYIILIDIIRRDCNGIDIECHTLSKDSWLWRKHQAILSPKVFHIECTKWTRRQSECFIRFSLFVFDRDLVKSDVWDVELLYFYLCCGNVVRGTFYYWVIEFR